MAISRNLVVVLAAAASALLLLITFHRSDFLDDSVGGLAGSGRRGHKPRYIFVDLGANSADSLEAFLQHENAKFQYDFPVLTGQHTRRLVSLSVTNIGLVG